MKRTVIFILAFALVLTNAGCFGNKSVVRRDVQNTSISTPGPTPTPTPTPTPRPKYSEFPVKAVDRFKFTPKDFFNAVAKDCPYEFVVKQDYGDYIAEAGISAYKDLRNMCFSDKKTGEVFAVTIQCDNTEDEANYTDFCDSINSAVSLYTYGINSSLLTEKLRTKDMNPGESSTYEVGGVSYMYVTTKTEDTIGGYITISIKNPPVDPKTLPAAMKKGSDFFTENREEVVDCYITGQYKKLISLANSYIKAKNPPKTDNAYRVKDILGDLPAHESEFEVEYYENLDEYYTYYKGAEDIGSKVNVSPFLIDGDIKFAIGYVSKSPIYFDNYNFILNKGDSVTGITTTVKRKELQNGSMEEFIPDDYLYDEDISKIVSSSAPVIRFYNTATGKHLDHKLTKTERNAIKYMFAASTAYKGMYYLTICWKYS